LDGESITAWTLLHPGAKMEFTALFLTVTIVMLVAWRGSRSLALGLYAATLLAAVATYLHQRHRYAKTVVLRPEHDPRVRHRPQCAEPLRGRAGAYGGVRGATAAG
jgi:hypothetical protein